jgi:hypothetical protein
VSNAAACCTLHRPAPSPLLLLLWLLLLSGQCTACCGLTLNTKPLSSQVAHFTSSLLGLELSKAEQLPKLAGIGRGPCHRALMLLGFQLNPEVPAVRWYAGACDVTDTTRKSCRAVRTGGCALMGSAKGSTQSG